MKYNSQNTRDLLTDKRLPGRQWLFLGAIASLIFLFYGSLVPLDYEYKPVGEAWSEFIALMSKGLNVRSRADLGENFLLMIPIGFFGMGAVWPGKCRTWRFPLAVIVWIICFSSSCTIEFAQTFFHGRTPSFSDILMQSIGSFAGITAWWLWGRKIWSRYFQSTHSRKSLSISEKILWIYLLALFGYNIVPLDVTLNPFAIYQKYKAGRIVLIPFGFSYNNVAEFVYAVTTDAIIWIPAGFLWVFTKGKKPLQAWCWSLAAITVIEVAQIFISSRIFDITDIITGSAGAAIGIILCLKQPFWQSRPPEPKISGYNQNKLTWVGLGLFFGWCFFLAAVFWYPYEVLIERKFVESQLNRFFQVPFHVYYYSGGLTAITAVFRKALFFIPLGIFLAMAARPLRKLGINSLLSLISLLCFAGAGLVIELGQALMPDKIPDSTDLLFETLGGILGFWLTNAIFSRRDPLQTNDTGETEFHSTK